MKTIILDELKQLNLLYRLKEIERANTISKNNRRHETSAEHTYSCIILAEFFLKKMSILERSDTELDELRVIKLLMYHDILEIYSGDHFKLVEDDKFRKMKSENEKNGFLTMLKQIPEVFMDEYRKYYDEFKKQKTIEARFALAIDKFDPMVQELFIKEDWVSNGFTEKTIRDMKEKYLKEFPIIYEYFEAIIEFASKKGYFVQ